MTAELLIAIALLCQVPNGYPGGVTSFNNPVIGQQLTCQQYYISCARLQTQDATQAAKAVANCIKDKK